MKQASLLILSLGIFCLKSYSQDRKFHTSGGIAVSSEFFYRFDGALFNLSETYKIKEQISLLASIEYMNATTTPFAYIQSDNDYFRSGYFHLGFEYRLLKNKIISPVISGTLFAQKYKTSYISTIPKKTQNNEEGSFTGVKIGGGLQFNFKKSFMFKPFIDARFRKSGSLIDQFSLGLQIGY